MDCHLQPDLRGPSENPGQPYAAPSAGATMTSARDLGIREHAKTIKLGAIHNKVHDGT